MERQLPHEQEKKNNSNSGYDVTSGEEEPSVMNSGRDLGSGRLGKKIRRRLSKEEMPVKKKYIRTLKKRDEYFKRSSDYMHRPVIAKNLKLPKVFLSNKEENVVDSFNNGMLKSRNQSAEEEMPFLNKFGFEKRIRKSGDVRKIASRSYLEGSRRDVYRSYKHDIRYKNGKVGGKNTMRGSQSCPKYFDETKEKINSKIIKINSSIKYTSYDDLPELDNPKEKISELAERLKSEDWNDQVKAIDMFRSLLKFNQDRFKVMEPYEFKQIVTNLSELIVSLRSFVSKSSLVAVQELTMSMERGLDKQLNVIIQYLLLKGQEKNIFLSKEVDKSLIKLTENCSSFKILSILLKKVGNKSSNIRQKVCVTIGNAIKNSKKKIDDYKNFQLLCQSIAKLLTDSSSMVRSSAKKTMEILSDKSENKEAAKKRVKSSLPENFKLKDKIRLTQTKALINHHVYQRKPRLAKIPQKKKIKAFIRTEEFIRENGKIRPRIQLPKFQGGISKEEEVQQKPKPKIKISDKKKLLSMKNKGIRYKHYPELNELGFMLKKDQDDWRDRIKLVDDLTDFGLENFSKIKQSKYCFKFFDKFLEFVNGSNVRVQVAAFAALGQRLLPNFGLLNERLLNIIVCCVFNMHTTNNVSIKKLAGESFLALLSSQDLDLLSRIVSRQFLNLPIKAKSNLSNFLIGKKIDKIFKEKMGKIEPEEVVAIAPILEQSLKGSKGELKKMSDSLLEAFMRHHGDIAEDYIPVEYLNSCN